MKTYNHTRIIIWAAALWIYVALVLGVSLEGKFSAWLIVLGTMIPFLALYFFLVNKEIASESPETLKNTKLTPLMRWYVNRKNKNKPSTSGQSSKDPMSVMERGGLLSGGYFESTPEELRRQFRKQGIQAVAAVFGAVFLAAATLIFIEFRKDPDSIHEWTAPFTNCKRDASKISTLPVNKTLDYKDAKVTVHNVTYNVPQNSQHPTAYSYVCEKATLVEVTIERGAGFTPTTNEVDLLNFSLKNEDQKKYAWSSHPESTTDEYNYYAKQRGIEFITRDLGDDIGKVSGWLVFSVREDNSNQDVTLTYGEYADENKPVVTLPTSDK